MKTDRVGRQNSWSYFTMPTMWPCMLLLTMSTHSLAIGSIYEQSVLYSGWYVTLTPAPKI